MIFQFQVGPIAAQDQRIADSLVLVYKESNLEDTAKLELLRNLSFNEVSDLKSSLEYAEELIALSRQKGNDLYLHRGYLQKGNKYRLTGDLELALEAFFTSAEVAVRAKYAAGEGTAYMSIADVYSVMGNANNAENYYDKAIGILRETTDSISLGTALLNAGDEYFNNKKFDTALEYFQESGDIFDKIDYQIGKAYNLGNIGIVYAEQGKDALAESNINQAINILEELEDYYPISVYLTYMADIYARKNELPIAFNYANRSLQLATDFGLKDQIGDAYVQLSELYEQSGNYQKAFTNYQNHIHFRDSVKNIQTVQQLADLRTDYEVSQKQTEVDLLNQQKRNQRTVVIATIVVLLLISLLAMGLYRRNRFIRKTKRIIENEKNRSENLLLNILPEKTAQELKEKGKVRASKFESVSVLFTDFKGFTEAAETVSPEILVKSIDYYFSKFDQIIDKWNLEKIKTIGDAYMCAGGLPFPTEDHAKQMIHAALEMAEFVQNSKKVSYRDQMRFDIRIGINTGPVVAGVVGSKKFAYDIWGDTVNVASRMESMSEPGKINISQNTYALIKDEFECTFRGQFEVKNRGMMKMYFVHGLRKS